MPSILETWQQLGGYTKGTRPIFALLQSLSSEVTHGENGDLQNFDAAGEKQSLHD